MRVLIVEDEVRLAEALCQILLKNKFAVDTVYDGELGLDYAMSEIYDVIILDIMLPKMNGIEVLKAIRNEKINTPVILLTAKDGVLDKVKGLDSGADDYLTKPFATEELLARIRALSRRKETLTEDVLSFGAISLNLTTNNLFSKTKEVKLSLKEFQIMELLMANGKHIITKERIIEKIWGYESDTEYNNVEVYISFLRKKMTYLGENVEIRTTRGVGYSLEEEFK